MQRRILANSMGWNAKLPKWIQSRAPWMGEKNSGATSKMPPISRSR